MNKHCFRVVFNQVRGQLMVVAEKVSSRQLGHHRRETRVRLSSAGMPQVRPLIFSLWLVFGLVAPVLAQTQVVADPNAPGNQQPVVGAAANGVRVVNIQTASEAGVSRNSYSQVTVGKEGLVLNNSPIAVQSQLAGWITGNPMLAGGSARIILNEVNSSDPSVLRGFIEVGGSRAEVVIANPSGIQCNGCGFINASRATLTTGTANLDAGGNLTGYAVRGGSVIFGAGGMDARTTDYTDVLARAVQVQGSIKATKLRMVAGSNDISADLSSISRVASGTDAPTYAIDVAALGGMVAGTIMLTATEQGVGVRNAGTLGASVGDVVISTSGQLINRNQIQATAGNVTLNADQGLINSGTVVAKATLRVSSAQAVDNQAGASLTAASTQLTSASLMNRGRIDGVTTQIQTDNLDLLGTGVLLGDHLSIRANRFTIGSENGRAAVAAARNRLDLGVQTLSLTEHALLHSEGDLSIGGQLDGSGRAIGKADSIALSSARIEAVADLEVNTASLSLSNAHFSSELRPDPRYPQGITEYQGSGSAKRYAAGSPNLYVYNDESDHLHTPQGNYGSWLRYAYTRNVQTEVVTQTDPSVISVGRHFTLNADTVLNDKSTVTVGGQLAGTVGSLTNSHGQGRQIIHDAGSVTSFWRQNEKGRDSTGSRSSSYAPADQVLSLTLQPAEWLQNTQNTAQHRASSLALPTRVDSSLFKQVVDPQSLYLVATDPRLADYRTWLSTDYMLQQLSNPTVMQKRLGDGYYEQRLVREQVAQLTGRRFLQGYSSDEAQFQTLMNNGVTEARALNLQPGIALTDAQVAQLTSNLVWLVKQPVTLPDGSVTEALLPKVYARADSVTVNGMGTLIAASDLKLDVAQQLSNGGTLVGWQTLAANAQTITLDGGQVYADRVALSAQNDLKLQGGRVAGHSSVSLQAGHDLTLQSTTASTQSIQGQQTNIDNVASVSVDGANAALSLIAGNHLNALAAHISNSSPGGSTQLEAGRDLNLGTIATSRDQTVRWDGDNWRHDAQSQDVGSTIQTSGDLTLIAGRDATLTGANLISDQGAVNVTAVRDVNVVAGRETSLVDEAHQHTGKSGLLASNTITTRDTLQQDLASGSTLSGNSLVLDAGRNLTVSGSNAVSTQQTRLLAGGEINLVHATNRIDEVHQKEERTTGLFSGGGLGVTLGVQQQNIDRHGTGDTAAATTVGATDGSVTIRAAARYQQTGSQVLAPKGDIDLVAQQVDITEARNVRRDETDTRFKQSGVSVALTTPILSAIQTGQQMQAAASQTGDARMQALAAATTALSAKNAYDAISQNPSQLGGANLRISLGTSQNQSHTSQTSDHAAVSTVNAGAKVSIAAVGDAQNSDLTLQGSVVRAGGNVDLTADHEIKLLAAKEADEQHSSNQSVGASVGFSVGSRGVTFDASVNGGRGHADGTDIGWINSYVDAGQQLTMTSGSDTTLKGARASAKQVTANVGGNLSLESPQDTRHYDSKQRSVGGSIAAGAGAMSASANLGRERMRSDYASVIEQSGIQAGDHGFQMTVKGNTDLIGAVIASSDQAVASNLNSLTTGTLTYRDIQNHASYEGSSFNIGAGYSTDNGSVGKDQQGQATTGGSAVPGSDMPKEGGWSATLPMAMSASGDASSTTRSGVSAGAILVTDDAGQQALNDKRAEDAVAGIARDVLTGQDNSNALKQIFNKEELQAQFSIVGAFTREAGTFLENRAKQADANLDAAKQLEKDAGNDRNGLSDAERLAKYQQAQSLRDTATQISNNWGAKGTYRQIATALLAGVSGNVSAGASEMARDMLVNYVQQQGAGYIGDMVARGELTEGSPVHAALHALVACSGAAASGQACSSGALGAAASSVLTGMFSDSSADETQEQREAKRNLLASLVTGIAAMSGENAATATTAASAAIDNNWLATQQVVQMNKELAKAKGSLIEQAKVLAKWGVIGGKQDLITGNALVLGLTSGMLKDAKGVVNLLSDLPGNLKAMQALLNSPDIAGKLSGAVRAELNQRFASINHALQVGGDSNAYQLGHELGELTWQVGSVLTGAGAAAKAGVSLARFGVTVSATTLKAMAATDLAIGVRAQVAVAGRAAAQAGKNVAAGVTETVANAVKRPAKTGAIVDNSGATVGVKGGTALADDAAITSGGTANSATGARLADDLAVAQAKDPRIGTTLPGANAPVTVTAESNIGGRTLVDTNQTARPSALADPNKPTLISDLVPPGKPNSTMANAHAEIGLVQQAYDAGLTQGQSMTIVVRGEAVCTYCQQSTNLVAAANRAGLNRLEVVDAVDQITYVWTRDSTGLVKK